MFSYVGSGNIILSGQADCLISDSNWVNNIELFDNSTMIIKTENTAAWDFGFFSINSFDISIDRDLEFQVGFNAGPLAIGISNSDGGANAASILFCFYISGTQVEILESGVSRWLNNYASLNDVYALSFKIRIKTTGNIEYYINDSLIYTSTGTIAAPIYIDGAIYQYKSTFDRIKINSDITFFNYTEGKGFVNFYGLRNDGTFNNWMYANTKRAILNDGELVYKVPCEDGSTNIGLIPNENETINPNWAYYGFFIINTELRIREQGADKVSGLSIDVGDILRIAIELGVVKYYRNESLLYQSLLAYKTPLSGFLRTYYRWNEVSPYFFKGSVDEVIYSYTGNGLINALGSADVSPILTHTTWTNFYKSEVLKSALIRNNANSAWDSGARSKQSFSGDGYAEFKIKFNTGRNFFFGLGNTDVDQGYADVDFAIYYLSNGETYVYESGLNLGLIQVFDPTSDAYDAIFKVAVESGVVKYYIDDVLKYTSGVSPTFPLAVDTSMFYNQSIFDATINGNQITWENPVNAIGRYNVLHKPFDDGEWFTNAVSVEALDGDGHIEFTADVLFNQMFVGLNSIQNTNPGIDFSFYFNGNNYEVRENGSTIIAATTFTFGDKFKIAQESNIIKYYVNNSLVHASITTPNKFLYVDVIMFSARATLSDVDILGFIDYVTHAHEADGAITIFGNAEKEHVHDYKGSGIINLYHEALTDQEFKYDGNGQINLYSGGIYYEADYYFYYTTSGIISCSGSGAYWRGDYYYSWSPSYSDYPIILYGFAFTSIFLPIIERFELDSALFTKFKSESHIIKDVEKISNIDILVEIDSKITKVVEEISLIELEAEDG